MSCVFCDIVAGRAEAAIVEERDTCLAIMDQRQAHPGHVLAIPKQHIENIHCLSVGLAGALMELVVDVSNGIKNHYQPQGISIWQSNGPAADQEVPHIHFHIHPRWMDDGLLRIYPQSPETPDIRDLKTEAKAIIRHLKKA